jgi:ketosteroid isomerase-like protein
MSENNARLARRGYEAMLAGDIDVVAELLDPGVVWHGGDPREAGACHNRQEALAFMRQARVHGRLGELVDVIDAGDQVIVILRPPSAGREPAEPIANLSTFRDGRVIEMVHFANPDDAIAAANAKRT